MSEATKRKYVTQEATHNYVTISKNQFIVKVLNGKGNNLHEVEDSAGLATLCSMPPKFRKNVWIKRGDFLLVEGISEGKRVTCEMINILYPMQIQDLKEQKEWPDSFLEEEVKIDASKDSFTKHRGKEVNSDSESESDEDDLEQNSNHLSRPVVYLSSDSESDSDG